MIRLVLLRQPREFRGDEFSVRIGSNSIGEKSDGGVGYHDSNADGPGELVESDTGFEDLYGDIKEANATQKKDVDLTIQQVNRQIKLNGLESIEEAEEFFRSIHSNVEVHDRAPHILYVASTIAPELDAWLPCAFVNDDNV